MNKIFLIVLGLVFSLGASEIYATFNVEADKKAELAFNASGVVKSVNYDVSQSVKKGQVLAVLVNSDIKAMLDSAKTALK